MSNWRIDNDMNMYLKGLEDGKDRNKQEIEKLQQENKQLKEEANDYKSRCEFAIDLIDTYGCYNVILEIKLYNCLRGEDDE